MLRKLVRISALSASIALATQGFAYDIPGARKPNLRSGDVEMLQRMSRGVSTISEHAKKGIVFVSVSKVVRGQPFGQVNPFDFFFGPDFNGRRGPGRQVPQQKQQGLGSGFIIDIEKGYILTNNHVIEGADEINLKFANNQTYTGKVVGRDKNTDVAVVKINEKNWDKSGLVQLSLGDSQEVSVGDICIALGAPFGLEASISLGVVSALGRGSLSITELGNFIQTDAAINPGNSGGPLLDSSGMVMGMNTAIYSKSGGYNGIGFAIPANLVRTVATQLINHGKVERGYLGVLMAEMDAEMGKELGVPKEHSGVLLRSVEPDSPADKGGLEAGDVIVKIDGRKIKNMQQMRNIIGLIKPNKTIKFEYFRNGRKRNSTVRIGNYNDAAVAEKNQSSDFDFGMKLANLNNSLKKRYNLRSRSGVVVLDVEPNSGAARAGLEEGDLLVKINNTAIKSTGTFRKLAKGKKRLLVRIERQGRFLFIPLKR